MNAQVKEEVQDTTKAGFSQGKSKLKSAKYSLWIQI
jgi:hypothetical protein